MQDSARSVATRESRRVDGAAIRREPIGDGFSREEESRRTERRASPSRASREPVSTAMRYHRRRLLKWPNASLRFSAAMLSCVLCLTPTHRASGQSSTSMPRQVELITLPVAPRDMERSVAFAASQVAEAEPRRRWSRRTHVVLGALAGAFLGTVIAYGPERNADANCPSKNEMPCISLRVPLTIGAGTIGGMIVGAVWPTTHYFPDR